MLDWMVSCNKQKNKQFTSFVGFMVILNIYMHFNNQVFNNQMFSEGQYSKKHGRKSGLAGAKKKIITKDQFL